MSTRKKYNDFMMRNENDEDISMLTEIQTDPGTISLNDLDKEIPIMPLRNMVMFPSVVMPITVGRPATQKLINAAYKKKQPIAVVCQIQSETEEPDFNDLYHTGVIAQILRVFEMPGGNNTVILQSNGPKVHLDKITSTSPYLMGEITPITEEREIENKTEFKALLDMCKDLTSKYIEKSEKLSPDTIFAIKNLGDAEILVNFVCSLDTSSNISNTASTFSVSEGFSSNASSAPFIKA